MRGTRAQRARQSARFLKALRRTGNATMAAEEVGIARKAIYQRRARNPDFAAEWDAAVSFAQAQLVAGGTAVPQGDSDISTGGEYTVRASRGRMIQVRRSPKGLLTAKGERTFLAHLAATANVRLSAEATGIGWNAIYARRYRSADFAREMEAALAEGYARLELALVANAIESLQPDGTELGAWRDEADALPETLDRMSAQNALLLLGYRRANIVEGRPHAGFTPLVASREETNKALEREIRRAERRVARDAAGQGRKRALPAPQVREP
ncbi:hypothetical protein [Sphingomonas hengshuiensis]|uniref:hypothetical protein n=1 Tax=Sphingomonas hengshuiensis TaxID=1609977 RepID=UPI000A9E01C9|nr:hypothetical protein [Sphingomonas hengshuiensis]